MNWTTKQPTELGYYWAYDNNKVYMIEIDKDSYGMAEVRKPYANVMGNECGRHIDKFFLFKGPLAIPKKPIDCAIQTAIGIDKDGNRFMVKKELGSDKWVGDNIGCDSEGNLY
jgi:hypothetical protein